MICKLGGGRIECGGGRGLVMVLGRGCLEMMGMEIWGHSKALYSKDYHHKTKK